MSKPKRKVKVPQRKKEPRAKKSMEAPLCKLCMNRHWSYQPHQFKDRSL